MNIEQLRSRLAAIKAEQPGWDCVGFVSGHFLNFYDHDAKVIAETLSVALSDRSGIAVCRLPSTAIDRHAKRLQAAGISVLIDYPPDDAAAPDTLSDDVKPLAWRDLNRENHALVIAATNVAHENQLRAAALIDRLAAYGLRDEAVALGVAGMTSYMRARQLDALETIVAVLEDAATVAALSRH
jgi:DNA mismatch repair ATPase MutS